MTGDNAMEDLMQACEEPGTWHMMEDMKPAAHGEYTVIRRRSGKKMDLDEMLWNGAYWVTRKGSVSAAVVAWFEPMGAETADMEKWENWMRKIMVAIQPQWAELIFIGSKTMEIRKTLPNNGEPFKAYVYVTEKHPLWIRFGATNEIMSGHIVGEFVCNGFDRFFWRDQSELVKEIRAKSQVTRDEMARYAGDSDTLFAWHISDVVEYNNIKKIDEFLNNKGNIMKRPPQSWEYVTPYRFGR